MSGARRKPIDDESQDLGNRVAETMLRAHGLDLETRTARDAKFNAECDRLERLISGGKRTELLPNNPGTLVACYYCGGANGRVIRYPSPFLRPVYYHPTCYQSAESNARAELHRRDEIEYLGNRDPRKDVRR